MEVNANKVSIVILNWNGLDDTLECLASIDKLIYRNVAVIVVDNASRNNQAETISKAFPSAIILPQPENLGFCGGCNVGIEYAIENNADYVMLLNNDTLVPTDLIERLLSGIENLDSVAAVSPVILEHPNTDKVWYSDARWVAGEAQFRLARPEATYEEISAREPFETEFACGCCMLIPVPVLKKVGLLDERYFAFYEEAAWCAKARREGLRSYVVPSAVMYHKVSRSTPALVSTYLLTRNRLLWMKENLPLATRLRSLPYLLKEIAWHSANLFGVTQTYYSKEHSRAAVQGYKDYFSRKFFKWNRVAERIILPES
jgi:GT2 family glycosyltransferase